MKKKFAIVFLSLFLVVSLPFAAHANIVTTTGRYIINLVRHAPSGARVEATNTVTGAKHVIRHGVSSADLGKSIGAGIVGFGLATGAGLAFKAITGLALDAVDWVLDPANNSVRYTDDTAINPSDAPVGKIWSITNFGNTNYAKYKEFGSPSLAEACSKAAALYNYSDFSVGDVTATTAKCYNHDKTTHRPLQLYDYPLSDIDYPTADEKSIPLNTLAQKILELADAGNAAAQKDVEDHVTHRAQNGDLDNELDNSSDITPSEEPENPEEPQNPTEPKECPSGSVKVDDVCVKIPDSDGDEPLFCDSSEFTKKVCDWIDWTQTEHDEPEAGAGEIEVIDKSSDLSIDKDRIVFDNQCPTPKDINITVVGHSFSDALDYQPLCDFFIKLKPFVVGMGGISSALIIAGGVRRG